MYWYIKWRTIEISLVFWDIPYLNKIENIDVEKRTFIILIMKPLQTNRFVLMWLCGFPPDNSINKWKRCIFITFTLCIVLVHSMSVMAGVTFIYRNASINLEETLFSMYHTMGSARMLYQSIITVVLCHELAAICEELSAIYRESELYKSQILYK